MFIIRAVWASNGAIGGLATWRVVSNADGHLCRSYAPIWCSIGHIRPLVGPWGCTTPQLGTGRSTGLLTDILGCHEAPLAVPEKVPSITRKWVFKQSSGPCRGLQAQSSACEPNGHHVPLQGRVTDIL